MPYEINGPVWEQIDENIYVAETPLCEFTLIKDGKWWNLNPDVEYYEVGESFECKEDAMNHFEYVYREHVGCYIRKWMRSV